MFTTELVLDHGGQSDTLPEDVFAEVLEGGVAIDVAGDDAGPVVAAVAGSPFGEPHKVN